jgi:predicted RNA binding protein YcfA (HicA-like mRNA interferase family)
VSKFPAVTGKKLVAAFKLLGFEVVRVKGSHHFIRHVDGRATVVPVHSGETIGMGLLSRLLRDTKIRRDELQKHL